MLDTAIVGGGVCGLALARALFADGHDVAVYEARARWGGRVLTITSDASPATIDLGPTWFWPDTQPLMARLTAELGLAHFAQHDEGQNLSLVDPEKKPDVSEGPVHGGARRLVGGMSALVSALREELPETRLFLEHVLLTVQDRGDHVTLRFATGDSLVTVEARRVVLAVPPRVLDEQVHFAPRLSPVLRHAMGDAATWMAAQAKAVLTYSSAHWRERGYSGNAFVAHERAVFAEIFDACVDHAGVAALGGFLALTPQARVEFARGLPMLMDNQVAQVFGPALARESQHYQDWASESFTCSERDRAERATHPESSNPWLRGNAWSGRLLFGSAETAGYACGYLEGALDAARRIERELTFLAALARLDSAPSASSASDDAVNQASLTAYRAWVEPLGKLTLSSYRERLNVLLAQQRTEQLTQRALLAAVEESFRLALSQLERLPFATAGVAVSAGRSALMPDIQRSFDGFLPSLMAEITRFNGTSCALANFPEESRPSSEYIEVIQRDLAAAFREFSRDANATLVSKSLTRHVADESVTAPVAAP